MINRWGRVALLSALAGLAMCTSLSAQAQRVISALTANVNPIQHMHSGRLASCGIEVTIGTDLTDSSLDLTTITLVAVHPMSGEVSGVVNFKTETVLRAQSNTVVPRGVIEAAWVRIEEGSALKLDKLTQEKDGSLSAVTGMAKAMEAIIKIVESGVRLQAGIRLKGSASDLIYSGIPAIETRDKLTSRACISEMISRMVAKPQ